MIDKNKIELVRQKIRGNLKIDPMFVENEPVHSGGQKILYRKMLMKPMKISNSLL